MSNKRIDNHSSIKGPHEKTIFSGKRRLGRCPGTGIIVTRVGLEERGNYSEETKEYQCPECGRWFKPGYRDSLPFHLKK